MNVTGGCHCGNIRFEAEVDPAAVSICHCTDCQRLSGSPYRASVRASADKVRFSGGEPAAYVKTADSGNRRVQAFCALCGSPLYATSEADRSTLNLRLGAIDQRAALEPKRRIWRKSALPWSEDVTDIPAVERE